MKKYTCELCENEIKASEAIVHSVVPREIIQQAPISDSKTPILLLCISCRNKLESWCQKRVSTTTYNLGSKKFIPKSPNAMVKEYEVAYAAFVNFEKRSEYRI